MTSKHENVLVADLMTDGVITCPGDANLAAVAATLARRNIHAVFVLDAAGQPCGVVSDFDLLAGEWLGDDAQGLRTMQMMTAREMMTAPLETIAAGASAADAAARLRDLRLSRLLVTDEAGAAVGVISVSDLVAPLGRPSGERRTVRAVMSYAIVTCLRTAPVAAAARAMSERRSRSIVVVDETGAAIGVITGFDLLSLYGPADLPETVADLIRTPLVTADPDLELAEAANLMLQHEVHRIVVVDSTHSDGAPIGILSTSDIVAEMAQERSVWQQANA